MYCCLQTYSVLRRQCGVAAQSGGLRPLAPTKRRCLHWSPRHVGPASSNVSRLARKQRTGVDTPQSRTGCSESSSGEAAASGSPTLPPQPRKSETLLGLESPADSHAPRSSSDEALEPLQVFPPEFDVTCKGILGRFRPGSWTVLCCCAACNAEAAEAKVQGGSGADSGPGVMTPWKWELHCGSRSKKSAQSIKILAGGGVADVPAGDRSISIASYLRRRGLKVAREPAPGGGRLLVPLDG